jgi:hypothetical protein
MTNPVAARIAIVKLPLAVAPARSVTLIEKSNTPIVVGLPLTSPPEPSDSPPGNDPEASENRAGSSVVFAVTRPK